jgi:hypothetical protein
MSHHETFKADAIDQYGIRARTIPYEDLPMVEGNKAYASNCLVPHAYEQAVWNYPIQGVSYATLLAIWGGEQHSQYWESVDDMMSNGYVKDESGEFWVFVQKHESGRVVLARVR